MDSKILTFSFVAALVFTACSAPEPPEAASESQEAAPAEVAQLQEFDVEQLKQRLDAGEDVFILDVRRPDELVEHGAIEDAVNIPIDDLEGRLSEIPKDRPIVVHCMRGGRASRAATLLQESGYGDVQYGGITAWKEKGYPVVYPEGGHAGGSEE